MHGVFHFAILRALTGALGGEFSSDIEKERGRRQRKVYVREVFELAAGGNHFYDKYQTLACKYVVYNA
jgi:hypothetical protein